MTRGVYTKTKTNAASVLNTAAEILTKHGRARKLPGKDREPIGGKPTLVTAITDAADLEGATKTARLFAVSVACSHLWNEYRCADLYEADNKISDTRALARELKAAARELVAA